MKTRLMFALALILALSQFAVAKIPPLEEEDLQDRADLIIIGEVVSVTAVGEVEHDHCYGWQRYEAQVKVEKTFKGDSDETILLVYSTRVVNDEGCVGGRDSYSFSTGDRNKMYLQRSQGEDKRVVYGFFNWAGLQPAP